MRIAVWWNLPPGGARRALRDHLRGLAERGHEIHVVRPPVPRPEVMAPDEFAASVEEVPLPDLNPEGRGYIGRVVAELRRVRRTVPEMERHSELAGRAILARKPDVLFANTCWLMAAPSVVRYVGDLPRVTYLQEPKRSLYEANPMLPWTEAGQGGSPQNRLRRSISLRALARQARLERENARHAGRLLVNSRFSRESVRRAYGLESTFCPLGVDTTRFVPGSEAREGFVLGVGALAPSKGVEAALLACHSSGLPLVWVGTFEDDVYGPRMRELAGQLDADVEWRIGVSDEELIGLYQRCLAVVASARLEPFGYTPIEAGACGAPVVALAEGGFRETVLDGVTGFLVDSDADLGPTLRQVADDHKMARLMSGAARKNAEEHWSLMAMTEAIERELALADIARASSSWPQQIVRVAL